jgi:peptidoglycan/xylan/chitin deacetylase (PgdA/CDA1 family)
MRHIFTYIRNSIIAVFSFTGITALYRLRVRKNGPLVRVVVFHDVTDADWFADMITYLATQYRIISPRAFFASEYTEGKIQVLITFDDGYASWERVCAPVLAKRGIHAVFFANSGLLDAYGDSDARARYVAQNLLLSSRDTLSWEGLARLHIDGHTIGGHTTTHARLSKLSKEMKRIEIMDDKKNIESHLGCSVIAFAYPFGRATDYSEETKEVVKDAGYHYVFTTESAFVNVAGGDPCAIPRLCIEDGLTTTQFSRWVEGGYDIFARLKNLCAR